MQTQAGSIRPPNAQERRVIEQSLKELGCLSIDNFAMLIHELEYRELFVSESEEFMQTIMRISSAHNVYAAGIFGGSFRGDRFRVSLDFADYLYRRRLISRTLKLNLEEAKRFLYGRSFKRFWAGGDGMFLVLDPDDEPLGLGRYQSGILINLIDKGWYLRKGG